MLILKTNLFTSLSLLDAAKLHIVREHTKDLCTFYAIFPFFLM